MNHSEGMRRDAIKIVKEPEHKGGRVGGDRWINCFPVCGKCLVPAESTQEQR